MRFSPRSVRSLGLLLACLIATVVLHAGSRVKDITSVDGGRDNQLVGYGLVVGLAGDGDSNAMSTLRSISNVLQRYGLSVNPADIKAKNVAAVMITADIGPFLRPGARLDVIVASMGDAKSVQGGVLLQTPLVGADGRVYAVAQGPVAIGGFLGGVGGSGGATVQKNHPTVGTISNGAIVEAEIPSTFVTDNTVRLLLNNPDFTSAARIAQAVNAQYGGTATAEDAATVKVTVPGEFAANHVQFLSALGQIEVSPDSLARVIINERTGTLVVTSTVHISQVAISLGSLTITISSNTAVSQPAPLSLGQTTPVQSTQTNVNEGRGGFQVIDESPTIQKLAAALNTLGISTREMMAVFQALKSAGALQADLVIN